MLDELKEFEVMEGSEFDINHLTRCVSFIASQKEFLTEPLIAALETCIPAVEDEEFDLTELVKDQLKSAVNLKRSYFSHSGKLIDGNSAREAKDALASVQQVIAVLIKQQEGLDRQARLFKMENILIQCAEHLPEEVRVKFLDEVSKQLGE